MAKHSKIKLSNISGSFIFADENEKIYDNEYFPVLSIVIQVLDKVYNVTFPAFDLYTHSRTWITYNDQTDSSS